MFIDVSTHQPCPVGPWTGRPMYAHMKARTADPRDAWMQGRRLDRPAPPIPFPAGHGGGHVGAHAHAFMGLEEAPREEAADGGDRVLYSLWWWFVLLGCMWIDGWTCACEAVKHGRGCYVWTCD